jgi:hypothetical protein
MHSGIMLVQYNLKMTLQGQQARKSSSKSSSRPNGSSWLARIRTTLSPSYDAN